MDPKGIPAVGEVCRRCAWIVTDRTNEESGFETRAGREKNCRRAFDPVSREIAHITRSNEEIISLHGFCDIIVSQ